MTAQQLHGAVERCK